MVAEGKFDFENIIFSFIDEFKILFFPDQWSTVFMDYSKNEILALLYIYRYRNVNMTEIAQYINAPLNTATGVINRLEKKKMVERVRSNEDRRIVQIILTDNAKKFIEDQKKVIEFYAEEIYKALSEEEKKAAFSILKKVTDVLQSNKQKIEDGNIPEKKVKKINIE